MSSNSKTRPAQLTALLDALREGNDPRAVELLNDTNLLSMEKDYRQAAFKKATENKCPQTLGVIFESLPPDSKIPARQALNQVLKQDFKAVRMLLKQYSPGSLSDIDKQQVADDGKLMESTILSKLARVIFECELKDHGGVAKLGRQVLDTLLDGCPQKPDDVLQAFYDQEWGWDGLMRGNSPDREGRLAALFEQREKPLSPLALNYAVKHEVLELASDYFELTPQKQFHILRNSSAESPKKALDYLKQGLLKGEDMKKYQDDFYAKPLWKALAHGHMDLATTIVQEKEVSPISAITTLLREPMPNRHSPNTPTRDSVDYELDYVRVLRVALDRLEKSNEQDIEKALTAFFENEVYFGRALSVLHENGFSVDKLPNRSEGLGNQGYDFLSTLAKNTNKERTLRQVCDVLFGRELLTDGEEMSLLSSLIENDHPDVVREVMGKYGRKDSSDSLLLVSAATGKGKCGLQKFLLDRLHKNERVAGLFQIAVSSDVSGGFVEHLRNSCDHHSMKLLENLFEAGLRPKNPDRLFKKLNAEFSDDSEESYEHAVEATTQYRCFPSTEYVNELKKAHKARAELVLEKMPERVKNAQNLRKAE